MQGDFAMLSLRCAALCAATYAAAIAAANATAQVAAPAVPAAVYAPTSLAAEPGLPRTPDGHPDLTGVVWAATFFGMIEATPMTPPELVLPEDEAKQAFDKMMAVFTSSPVIKKTIETDPEASALLASTDGFPIVRGQRRTRLVVLPSDGKIPYTPEARKEASGAMAATMTRAKADNPEERSAGERCITLGGKPPIAMMDSLHPRQFIQAPGYVVINTEYGDEARIAPFAVAHGPAALHPAMGDSIARWEGDTLVVETTGFAGDGFRGAFPTALILNPDAKVIERFTRLSKDELLYQFTVEDSKVYTAPWLAEYSLFRAPYRMYPSGCHEGNYSLLNILSGQRVADAGAAMPKP
jgi:hypothetical protein